MALPKRPIWMKLKSCSVENVTQKLKEESIAYYSLDEYATILQNHRYN
jgi:hypothetical protein